NTITLASGALLQVNANGSYSYNPNGVFNALAVGATALDSFSYTASDGNGGSARLNATHSPTAYDDAPSAETDVGTTNQHTLFTRAAAGLLANSTVPATGDLRGLPPFPTRRSSDLNTITLASGALLQVNANGSYSYNPNGVFNALAVGATALDSFSYTASD